MCSRHTSFTMLLVAPSVIPAGFCHSRVCGNPSFVLHLSFPPEHVSSMRGVLSANAGIHPLSLSVPLYGMLMDGSMACSAARMAFAS